MKKVLAILLILLVVGTGAPRAAAAGYELPEGMTLTAAEVYVINLDTGQVVYEKDADTPRSVASLTKLMTALLLMENVPDLENTMITAERLLYVGDLIAPGSSTADIRPGEQVSALNMLYAMMLPSANEAAEAVGYYLSGGNLENFYALMNARAQELGCTNTQFSSTNGLKDQEDGNWSTAHDIALIAQACWQYEIFRTVCGTQMHWMPFTSNSAHDSPAYPEQNPNAAYYILSTNRMMDPGASVYRSYIKGIKTGSTYAAGRNFVSAAVNDAGESFIAAVLGCPWDAAEDGYAYTFHDTAALYDWIFDSFSVRPTLDTSVPITEVRVNWSAGADTLALAPADDLVTFLPNDSEGAIEQTFDVPQEVDAPVAAGDVLGTVTLSLSGSEIGTVDLVATQDVERSLFLYVMSQLGNFFTGTYVRVVAVLTALFLAGYAGLAVHMARRQRAQRRRGRYHSGGFDAPDDARRRNTQYGKEDEDR